MKKRKTYMFSILNFMMGALCGFLCLRAMIYMDKLGKSNGQVIATFLLLIVFMLICQFLQLIVHEGGHLVFGLLSGYRFLSFRIASFMWIKKENKLHFCRLRVAGTGGQCLLDPPDMEDGNMPYILYNMGGCLMNVLVSTICLLLMFLFFSSVIVSSMFAICAITGYFMALMNGIPMHAAFIDNDGCNTRSIARCPEALSALWLQMKISASAARNVRLKDMQGAWFEKPNKEFMQNSLVATIAVFRCNRLLDMGAYEEAKVEIEELLNQESGILGLHYHMLINDLIYLELISDCRKEKIEQLSTKAFKKFCKQMRTSLSILRTQYASALLLNHDEQKAKKLKETFDKASKSYPYQSDIESELEMMAYVDTLYQKDC